MSGAMPIYKTMDDYISDQSQPARKLLNELRLLVHETVPESMEVRDYKVPVFKLVPEAKTELQLMMMAGSKFVSFYPFASTLQKFADQLKKYKMGKGSVNFPFGEELPVEIIKQLVLHRKDELLNQG